MTFINGYAVPADLGVAAAPAGVAQSAPASHQAASPPPARAAPVQPGWITNDKKARPSRRSAPRLSGGTPSCRGAPRRERGCHRRAARDSASRLRLRSPARQPRVGQRQAQCTLLGQLSPCVDHVAQLCARCALHAQVLRFYAFFEEAVPNSPLEKSRVRKCVRWMHPLDTNLCNGCVTRFKRARRARRMEIMYYLVDGTVEVTEPRVNNSGLPQGAYLKRIRVPKGPAPPPGAPPAAVMGPDDFAVGADVTLFGRTFHICGCDPYTRAFYADQGVEQAPDTVMPESPLDAQRALAAAAAARKQLGGAPTPVQRGMQFLANDGKVLRFPGLLTDPEAEGGARSIIFNFYLGDSTGEVKEPGVGLLLHRQPLPVEMPVTGVAAVGVDPNAAYLTPDALRVGNVLRVFAREFTLLDADPFTRKWYLETLGIEQPAALPGPAPRAPPPKQPLPPWNGYGSPADSARNCVSLVPKSHNSVRTRPCAVLHSASQCLTLDPTRATDDPQDKDYAKYMAFSGKVLRFTADMSAIEPAVLAESDVGRSFVVNYFLEDSTLSIFEPQKPDRPASRCAARSARVFASRVHGSELTRSNMFVVCRCSYLERTTVCAPGSEKALPPGALRIGAQLIIYGRRFTLLSCDGFTEGFMKEHSEMWA